MELSEEQEGLVCDAYEAMVTGLERLTAEQEALFSGRPQAPSTPAWIAQNVCPSVPKHAIQGWVHVSWQPCLAASAQLIGSCLWRFEVERLVQRRWCRSRSRADDSPICLLGMLTASAGSMGPHCLHMSALPELSFVTIHRSYPPGVCSARVPPTCAGCELILLHSIGA